MSGGAEHWSAQVTQHQSTEYHSIWRMETKSDTEPLMLNHNGREKFNNLYLKDSCLPGNIVYLVTDQSSYNPLSAIS